MNIWEDIPKPIISVLNWPWNKALLHYAVRHRNIISVPVSKELRYDRERYFELLDLFDTGKSGMYSAWFEHQRAVLSPPSNSLLKIMKRIMHVKHVYHSIKHEGFLVPPVLTDSGFLVDGNHRVAISIHLCKEMLDVNIVQLDDVFDGEELQAVRDEMEECREERLSEEYQRTHGCGRYSDRVWS